MTDDLVSTQSVQCTGQAAGTETQLRTRTGRYTPPGAPQVEPYTRMATFTVVPQVTGYRDLAGCMEARCDCTNSQEEEDKQLLENYRPVIFTSVPCKILEALIRDELMRHFDMHSLLSEHQHSFRPRHSCSTQLLEALDDWTRMMDSKILVDMVYLDFQKPFYWSSMRDSCSSYAGTGSQVIFSPGSKHS